MFFAKALTILAIATSAFVAAAPNDMHKDMHHKDMHKDMHKDRDYPMDKDHPTPCPTTMEKRPRPTYMPKKEHEHMPPKHHDDKPKGDKPKGGDESTTIGNMCGSEQTIKCCNSEDNGATVAQATCLDLPIGE